MELDFGLPIAFSYDFFTIEAEPGYILPLYDDNGAQEMKGFHLSGKCLLQDFLTLSYERSHR